MIDICFMGKCQYLHGKMYVAQDFGYILIDEANQSLDIFKNTAKDDLNINVANCRMIQGTDGILTITSSQPVSSRDLDFLIEESHGVFPDSISVCIKIPQSEVQGISVLLIPSFGSRKTIRFSADGTVNFRVNKLKSHYDNFFSVIVFPETDPFIPVSSWGNSQTLSFLDLRLDHIVDVTDPSLSELVISITNFTDDIFKKWVILNDFIIKDEERIIWRNIVFERF